MKRGLNIKLIVFLGLFLVSFVLLNNVALAIEDSFEGSPCFVAGSDEKCPLRSSTCWHTCIQNNGGSLTWGACSPGNGYVDSENLQTCSNGDDDDCDGLIDCADRDCGGKDQEGSGDIDEDNICDNFDNDNDNDGINDDVPDIESDTHLGCKVDEHGKAIDNDRNGEGDGVCDLDKRSTDNNYILIDKCLGTTCGTVDTDYSSSRVGCPLDCSSCPTDPSCNACEKCSTWFLDFCSPTECFAIGNNNDGCYYAFGIASSTYGATCLSCGNLRITESSTCPIYINEESCLANQCLNPGNIDPNLPRCEWKGRSIGCKNIDMNNYYKDFDQDGYGDQNNAKEAYEPPSGYIAAREDGKFDCVGYDDNNNVHPDAEEICDGIDNDCDTLTPLDANCACTPRSTQVCPLPQSNILCTQTCNDQGQWNSCDISRAGQENTQILCFNGQDDDCDGLIDCVDPDCGGNGQVGSGNWDANEENSKVCNNFDPDNDNDGVNDFDSQGNVLDQEQFTPLECKGVIDAFGKQIDSDGDKVCDGKEATNCKNTAPGCGLVDSTGCPTDHACEANPSCYGDTYCINKVLCSDCGTFLGFGCSYNACSSIGNCYYNPQISSRVFGNICNSCQSNINTCGDYVVEGDCKENDPCGLETTCLWNSDRCCDNNNGNGVCDDEEQTAIYYRDSDGDGYPDETSDGNNNPKTVEQGGTIPENFVLPRPDGKWDCEDDNDININPNAEEICSDGKDNDCNSQTDEVGCKCDLGDVGDSDEDDIPNSVDQDDCTPIDCFMKENNIIIQGWMDPTKPGVAKDGDNDGSGDGVCDTKDLCLHSNCAYINKDTGCPAGWVTKETCPTDPFFGVSTTNINYCRVGNAATGAPISCLDYTNELDCTNDLCKVGNCKFEGNACVQNEVTYYLDNDGDGVPGDYRDSTDESKKRTLNVNEPPPNNNYILVNNPDSFNFDCDDNTGDDPSGGICPTSKSNCKVVAASCAICIYPGATEICDGNVNNNCDGPGNGVDEGCFGTVSGEGCENPGETVWCNEAKKEDINSGCYRATKTCQDGIWSTCNNPKYQEPENDCEDEIDNDCDNLIDCADSDCASNIQLCPNSDADGDGVLNAIDVEDDTPEECKNNVWPKETSNPLLRGVAKDNDNDGVCDGLDRCPGPHPENCEVMGESGGVPGCPVCENSSCASDNYCKEVGGTTGSGPGGQCSCKLVADACEENVIGTSAEENGLVLACSPTDDGKPRILTGLKIIDFNDPFALKADGINKYKIKCCTLKCAES